MAYSGPVQCPNCKCPIARDSIVCPYCHATVPTSAPWKQGSWTGAVILFCGLLLVWSSDRYFGTNLVESLRSLLDSSGS